MSITSDTHDEQSPEARLSANLQIAIDHIEAADVDWLWQIAELLGELDPETRSAHCPECSGSQLIFTELVYMHHKITDADATHWQFAGDGDQWRLEACGQQ